MWICPNNKCHLSHARRPLGKLPPLPETLPVVIGTNLSATEKDYLRQMGFKWSGKVVVPNANPNQSVLQINVDLFREKINLDDPTFCLSSHNGRNCRHRFV